MIYYLDRVALAEVVADLVLADACLECGQQPRIEVCGDNEMCVAMLHSSFCSAFADEVRAEIQHCRAQYVHNLTAGGQ